MIPEESPADVGRELRDLIKGAARNAAGIEVEIRRILLARPLTPLKGGERLVKRLAARASQVMGEPVGARACRSTPTRATTPQPASRRCSTAPARAPSRKPTPTAPTSAYRSTTSTRQPRWWR